MQFCDDCGSMMKSMGSKMVCANDDCQATTEKDEERAKEFVSTEEQGDSEVIETEEGADFEGKPTATDITCDKCGHGEAWYTIKQTASADEPPTRFFKCKECGYRWREYN
ncbi:transcription factor S [Haladaptatus caseinilyticus]|uniref:transcription factor S n=1 Tax=Haladaptatus caseinilyticus TaxID=2993314 RepID=UPI00224AD8B8|nr:transcription factor S [Haladaptatus caseinilyticus]